MHSYYSKRANEYEAVYYRDDLVRQAEQRMLEEQLKIICKGKKVLEVACGTGYWTKYVTDVAAHITAIDYSEEVLVIAKEKGLSKEKVTFQKGDAFSLEQIKGDFQGAYANFWFSHIKKGEITSFLMQLHQVLGKGAIVCFADNLYNEGIGGEFIRKDGDINTYKIRTLLNGERYEIIKNYYTKEELQSIFEPFALDLNFYIGDCFWWVTYKVK
ncbi:class I SAM-dependent DNA methyltransferase [Bacillus cereus]|uniref:class I SAM-dependent DNA methyltransferase n=1 Tax=Bacillus cereus TaxID=1396 RepID=UPI000995CE60|nr:class I SAM-dependent methyltransferase [Bacillus cereus]